MDKKGFIFIISFLFFLHSCGTLPEKGQGFRYSESSYNELYQSAIEAVNDIDFSVVSSDVDSGVIIAEKSAYENERDVITYRLEISIEAVVNGVKVEITSDRELPIAEDKNYLKEFVKALKKKAPAHLNVVSR